MTEDQLNQQFNKVFEYLDKGFGEIREELKTMNQRMDRFEGRLENLESDVTVLKTDVAEIKTDVAVIKETIHGTLTISNEQQDAIDDHEQRLQTLEIKPA